MSGWKIFWSAAKWDLAFLLACLWTANSVRGIFSLLAWVGVVFLGIGIASSWRSAWIQAEAESVEKD